MKSRLIGKDPDAGKDPVSWETRGQQRVRWLDSITNSMDMNLSKHQEIVKNREPDVLQSMGSQIVRHDLATEQQTTHKPLSGLC